MELTELSSQLKTFDIVDNQNHLPSDLDEGIPFVNKNRRLTRSQTLPKSDLRRFASEYPVEKSRKKLVNPDDEIKNIYLNKKVKFVHKNLETIYEDPVNRKGSKMFLGIGKQKRSLYLCREFRIITKQKSKMRKTKIKKLGKKTKPCKMSDDEFRERMMRIDNFINGSDTEENALVDDDAIENGHSVSCLQEYSNVMQAQEH